MNRTKDAIVAAFWELLEERPYNKITVKDIVDRCQINRNTFYYHFHDIPELLESTIRADADEIIRTYSKCGSSIDCLTPIVQHSLERKKAMLHIYRSIQREVFLNQLERSALYAVTQYIDTISAGMSIRPEDRVLLIRFYKCMLVGIILDWLDNGMNYDILKNGIRIDELFQGASRQAFLRAAEKPGKIS
ncbi:MAG: TetR/AcrR family transcriptional regulator [Candidatus Limivivens sp.]|nr:TetR/AcrR family transcriptional regulator [Candidatus Limivivens sp.]